MSRPRTDDAFLQCADTTRWTHVIARLCPERAINLDTSISHFDPHAAEQPGQTFFPQQTSVAACPQSENGRPAIGIMLQRDRQADDTVIAGQLAALAIERDCEIVILSEEALSGFERYGFRTERIAGETEEERNVCIAQIRSFWGLEIIL